MTDAERKLWQHFRRRQVGGYRFRRQHPLGPYIVDFVCLEARLIVEVDGGQHGSAREYDVARTSWLGGKGFTVVRFWNDEVLNQPEAVLDRIHEALAKSHARPPSQPSL